MIAQLLYRKFILNQLESVESQLRQHVEGGAPSLVGVGGFARTFIDMGASAVIVPLWSVKDDIAHKVALEFYKRITIGPSITCAEVFRRLRAKAYTEEDAEDTDATNGEDTYAANCFYGDPLSSRAVN